MFRDPERIEKVRIAVRYLLDQERLRRGHQTRLAEHFGITRQRVNQIVDEERARAAIRRLIDRRAFERTLPARIAAEFGISAQQVVRLADEERERAYAIELVAAPMPQRRLGRDSIVRVVP
jgi:DNA-binding transcriptional regulator LsrR (DeoR family)